MEATPAAVARSGGSRWRWLVDISKWQPSNGVFSAALSALPPNEHAAVTRFVKLEDRKRALVSRLLQYLVVHEILHIPLDRIVIKRTRAGKPYLDNGGETIYFPNFNFSVSHQGDYVGIASEPVSFVGFDIVSIDIPKQETVHDFINGFSSYFTIIEWRDIHISGNSDEMLAKFYRYWCLKEAYVKALGSGVGYGLQRLEFHHTNWTNISVYVDGLKSTEWKFWLFELDKKHLASIAKRHPDVMFQDSSRSLALFNPETEEVDSDFHLSTVEELIKGFCNG